MTLLDLLGGMLGMEGVWLSHTTIQRELAAQCAAGEALACTPDWWDADRADGLDLHKLAAAARPACDGGDAEACVALGLALTQALPGRPSPWLSTWAEGVSRLESACPTTPRACGELARALAFADPVHVDGVARVTDMNTIPDLDAVWQRIDARPGMLAAQGCEAHDAVSCTLLARSLERGWWEEAGDPSAAWSRACAAGSAAACFAANPADPAVATTACAAGVADACAVAAQPDPDVLDRACWSRDADACFAMARVEPSPALAFVLARRACAEGGAEACVWAADLARRSAWADDKAFLGDQPFSTLASWWHAWRDVGAAKLETDWWTVAPTLDAACRANDESACVDLAQLQALGLGLDRDAKAAVTTLGGLCELGSARACRALDQLQPDPAARQRQCAAARTPYCALPARKSFYVAAPPPGAHLRKVAADPKHALTLTPSYAKKYPITVASCLVRLSVDATTGRPRTADATDCHPLFRAVSERAGVKSVFVSDPALGVVAFDLRTLFRLAP